MDLFILTYDVPHLKTQQLLAMMVLDPSWRISLLGLPFISREPRHTNFQHRPNMRLGGEPSHLARHYDIPYRTIKNIEGLGELSAPVIIAGAGILPIEFTSQNTIINCHGGIIPAVRGLDAFKWAIHERQPLGNTLHVIDSDIDAGRHLKALRTPVFRNDTIESLARRHYENELLLLGNFSHFMENPEAPPNLTERPPRKRMPTNTERAMIAGFDDYLKQFAVG